MGVGYIMDPEDRQWIESRFDKLGEQIVRIETIINPKMEQIVEHEQWIKNHEKSHTGKKSSQWKMAAIIVAAVGGIQGLEKLISFLALSR